VSGLTLDSGSVDIMSGGITFGTTVLSGATEHVLIGTVSGTNISSGGVEILGGGDTDSYSVNTTVSSGAVEVLSGLAGASGTTVLSGGELILVSGGASGAVVAGTEIVQGGGEDYDSVIESGGLHVVQGRSYYAVLSGGGEEVVSSGGTTTFTTVDSGAEEIVSSGGAATGSIISSGGIVVVSSGGSAGAAVLDGGYELVASGGIVSGATISGGTLEVASGGAIAHSVVEFAGAGTLQLDGGTGSGWLVAGFNTGDQIDFRDIAFTGGTTSTKGKKGATGEVTFAETAINVSGTLTVTDGVNTANVALLDQYTGAELDYTAANFTSASDGHGGTLVTFTSATLAAPHHA